MTKKKLQVVRPRAVSPLPALAAAAAVAVLLLLLTAAGRPSFLGRYEAITISSVASLPSGYSSESARRAPPAVAVARVPSDCDIFRGEWVPDDGGGAAPYYTNESCPLIQEHQNCMKYGRPDLGFLRWRWRPERCELPRFDAAAFLELVRGKSMAFVGDSLARNHMQSLMCLLSKVEYPKDVSKTRDPGFRTMHYESHNFTIAVFWSPYLVTANQSSDPAAGGLWDLYLDEPDAAWAAAVAGFDYAVVSAANWFTRPSMFHERGRLVGCHYCLVPGVPDLTLRYSLRAAFRTALRALAAGAGGAGVFNGTAIVRTLSPTSHFEGGEWNKGGDCRRTRPSTANETRMSGLDLDFHTAQVEELLLMDTTAAMVARADGHPSRYGHWAHEKVTLYNDCVHWCLPGPIDVWNEMLLQMLLLHQPGAVSYYNPRCLIPAVSLLLLVVILTVSNTYFPFPTTKSRTLSYSSFSSSPGGQKAANEACNIFRGEWVPDPDAPYYTNDTCSVIHEHYDCMKYGKPDLGFVQWRWRPDSCDLPRLDPAGFLSSMRGKTLAFIGDSLARNHMNSLICLLTRVKK
uniref:Trichome birefringence-like N-terminal domain-containing protein n=1 Tax=Oryza barthii TaxID=65489 RepID=A0A0D3GF82_9ORYZ